jgi:CAAX prenyl protease-like protein
MNDPMPGHARDAFSNAEAPEAASPESAVNAAAPSTGRELPRGPRVFGRYAVWILVVPFVVYLGGMMMGSYFEDVRIEIQKDGDEPAPDEHADFQGLQQESHEPAATADDAAQGRIERLAEDSATTHSNQTNFFQQWFPRNRTWYPSTYTIVIAITAALMLVVSPGYFRAPLRVSWLSVVVGALGVVVWVGLSVLDEKLLGLGALIAPSSRPAFNPFEQLQDDPRWMYQFLAIRFAGLVLVVPVVEEFFLRGFLMRFIDDPDWDEIPLGEAGLLGTIGATAYGVFAHMGEPLAAAVWFSMVTWMYLRTRSIWDCVVAHLITNLLLGIYIISTGHWSLW